MHNLPTGVGCLYIDLDLCIYIKKKERNRQRYTHNLYMYFCLKWHGFPSCPLIYSSSEPLELGTPTCLVPKHLQIRKVEHPKHNAFQRFRRDLRNTSGRLTFFWEPMLFLLKRLVL